LKAFFPWLRGCDDEEDEEPEETRIKIRSVGSKPIDRNDLLTEEDVNKILEYAKSNPRDLAMIESLDEAGERASELLTAGVGDVVLDPMSGSGTMVDVCKELKCKCRAFDINLVLYRADIEFGDARKLPLDNESVDFVFIHFPYWRMHYYTDPPHPADLSRMDHENFFKASKRLFKQ